MNLTQYLNLLQETLKMVEGLYADVKTDNLTTPKEFEAKAIRFATQDLRSLRVSIAESDKPAVEKINEVFNKAIDALKKVKEFDADDVGKAIAALERMRKTTKEYIHDLP